MQISKARSIRIVIISLKTKWQSNMSVLQKLVGQLGNFLDSLTKKCQEKLKMLKRQSIPRLTGLVGTHSANKRGQSGLL